MMRKGNGQIGTSGIDYCRPLPSYERPALPETPALTSAPATARYVPLVLPTRRSKFQKKH